MSNIQPVASIRLKTQVIENCWQYVFENFHKFTDNNKIKVALAIISKDLPTKIEGDVGQKNETHIHYPPNWKPKEERLLSTEEQKLM